MATLPSVDTVHAGWGAKGLSAPVTIDMPSPGRPPDALLEPGGRCRKVIVSTRDSRRSTRRIADESDACAPVDASIVIIGISKYSRQSASAPPKRGDRRLISRVKSDSRGIDAIAFALGEKMRSFLPKSSTMVFSQAANKANGFLYL